MNETRKRKLEGAQEQDIYVIPILESGTRQKMWRGNEMQMEKLVSTQMGAHNKVGITDNLPYELIYSIDDHFIIVISHCCENTIQHLCLSHNVNISFGARQLLVSGRKRDCDDALNAIKSMLKPLLNVAAVERNRFIPFEKLEPIQVKENVIVPVDAVGLVAGKQFTNVIRLQETYGVKVTVPFKESGSNEILVEGPVERVAAAKFDILDNIPYILKQDIDTRFVGLIIGKKGEGLKRLSENYDIGIMFEDNKTAIITGKKENCEAALSEIYSIVEKQLKIVAANPFERQHQPEYVKEKVVVPMDIVGLVAGKKFANVIRIQETYGVKVTVPAKDSGSNEILVEGLVYQVAAAKVDILENSYVLSQDIDAQFVGLIIGKKGEGLNRVFKDHNLLGIKFEDNKKIIITGKKERCEAASSAIKSIVEANIKKTPVYLPPVFIPFESQQPEYVKEKVVVPMDIVGLVAGKKFANVIRIQETYGVKVTVPAKDSGSNEILVEGLVYQVAAAKVDILENSYVLSQDIDAQFVGLIIGKKGEGLNHLVKNHNLLGIKFVNNMTVYITGRKDRCEAALSEIYSIVEKYMQPANVMVVQRTVQNLDKFTWPVDGFQ